MNYESPLLRALSKPLTISFVLHGIVRLTGVSGLAISLKFVLERLRDLVTGRDSHQGSLAQTPQGNRVQVDLATSGSVSVIVPTRDRSDLLSKCLSDFRLSVPIGFSYEVIILDNGSAEKDTLDYLDKERSIGSIVIPLDIPFNFSKLCNAGAERARYGTLLFLNNDIEGLESGWLERMYSLSGLENSGAVGIKLRYPSGRIQHAGIELGRGGVADHVFRGLLDTTVAANSITTQSREVSAVTGAVLMVSRSKFDAVGGFDELLPGGLNDVDFSLKLLEMGMSNYVVMDRSGFHLESESRGYATSPEKVLDAAVEIIRFRRRWGNLRLRDEYPWISSTLIDFN